MPIFKVRSIPEDTTRKYDLEGVDKMTRLSLHASRLGKPRKDAFTEVIKRPNGWENNRKVRQKAISLHAHSAKHPNTTTKHPKQIAQLASLKVNKVILQAPCIALAASTKYNSNYRQFCCTGTRREN